MSIIYEATDYSGTRFANAYRSSGIINEAKKLPNWKQQEVYLYNEIAKRTTPQSVKDFNNQPRQCTAIGALLDGKANCQGYSDAFYMLGRMMKWNVGRMSRTDNNGVARKWNFELAPAIQGSIDENYAYCVYDDLERASDTEAGLKLLAKKIANHNKTYASVVVPYNKITLIIRQCRDILKMNA